MDWLAYTFTLPVAIAFVLGVAGGLVINWLANKRKSTEGIVRQRFQIIVGVVIIIAMLFIMITTQRAHDCAVKLSATISVEQELAAQERKALQDLFLAALNPPPEIAGLSQDDPARKAWGQGVGKAYLDSIAKVTADRDANEANRQAAQKACGR
jgi:predicted PurR-regulated permease PerM